MTETATIANVLGSELSLEELWMPFTANRAFKRAPRLLASAKGMYYTSVDGRRVLDGTAGLWCVNAGPLSRADRASGAGGGRDARLRARASRWVIRTASRSRSEWRRCCPAISITSSSRTPDPKPSTRRSRSRWRTSSRRARRSACGSSGRMRGYHGVGFGGISVGGIEPNRRAYAAQLLPQVDHLPHTHDLARNAFSRGEPTHGAELADDLERIVRERGAETIAAVIVEPMAGSTGVLDSAEGLPHAASRAVRQARHPADLRRSHHGIRPTRRSVRRRLLRRDAGPDDGGEGPNECRGSHGGRVRSARHLRHRRQLGAGGHRALSRLHVLGAPARGGRGSRDARAVRDRGAVRARRESGTVLGGRASLAARASHMSSTFATSVSLEASSSSRERVHPARAPSRSSSTASTAAFSSA